MVSDQQERYYNIFKLNKWFAISSILFTGFWVLTFADDYNRPWKKYQIEFRKMEIEKVRSEISTKQEALEGNEDYQLLLAQLDLKQAEFNNQQGRINEVNQELERIEGAFYSSNQNYQFSKADFDAVKYQLEDYKFKNINTKALQKQFDKLEIKTKKI